MLCSVPAPIFPVYYRNHRRNRKRDIYWDSTTVFIIVCAGSARHEHKFEKITGQKYSKNDRSIYQKLVQHGDEKKAIQMAERCYKRCVEDGKRKPSEMWPACRVHRLVEEIQEKVVSNYNN